LKGGDSVKEAVNELMGIAFVAAMLFVIVYAFFG
jgi:hypothetical protein